MIARLLGERRHIETTHRGCQNLLTDSGMKTRNENERVLRSPSILLKMHLENASFFIIGEQYQPLGRE